MKRLVLTLGLGPEGQAFLHLSLPFLAAYARRIGADCRVITQPTQGDPLMWNFEKFQIQSYFRDYERILYVDADVLVLPHAPDIFAAVGARDFAAWDESSLVPRAGLMAETRARLGLVESPADTIFNMGVFVAARIHASLFDPVPPELMSQLPKTGAGRFSDQLYLNWNLQRRNISCRPLPLLWNWNPICGHVHPRANFVHFLGEGFFEPERDRRPPPPEPLPKRLRQMAALIAALPGEIPAAEPALDLCVTGPHTRSAIALPPYLLPAGEYEVDFQLAPLTAAEGRPVSCVLFGKKEEDRVLARWQWPEEETRVIRRFTTAGDLAYPHFCFHAEAAARRVTGLKIRWRGDLPPPGPPRRRKSIFGVRATEPACEPAS